MQFSIDESCYTESSGAVRDFLGVLCIQARELVLKHSFSISLFNFQSGPRVRVMIQDDQIRGGDIP